MSVSIARLVGAAATALTVAVAGAQQPAAPASGAMKDTTKMAGKGTKKRAHRAHTASKAHHDSTAATPKPR